MDATFRSLLSREPTVHVRLRLSTVSLSDSHRAFSRRSTARLELLRSVERAPPVARVPLVLAPHGASYSDQNPLQMGAPV